MTHIASGSSLTKSVDFSRYSLILLAALLICRAAAIVMSPLHLGPDEAQYWRWGQSFDWGYYSKPPFIAWVIGTTTRIFGDTAWAVRLPAPFLHTMTGWILFLVARRMEGPRVGFYAVLIYIFMPGVSFSSGLMTTDSVLFVFWALALYLLWRMRMGDGSKPMAFGLGLAIGAGFLAKYAMVYFIIGLGLALLTDPRTRTALTFGRGGLVALGALLALGPHIGWNLANELQTLSHTADNANWGATLFHPEHAVKFLVDQMGVFGPVSFLTLLGGTGFVLWRRKQASDTIDRWLLCFILPALVIILGQAITARAHANWAATAYLAASILVARWMASERCLARPVWLAAAGVMMIAALNVPDLTALAGIGLGSGLALLVLGSGLASNWRLGGLLWAGVGVHLVAAFVFTAFAAGPTSLADKAGLANAFKRVRGWDMTVERLSEIADERGAKAILVDERENWHGLDFYGRKRLAQPVYAWPRYASAKSFADTYQLESGFEAPVLVVNTRADFVPRLRADFAHWEPVAPLVIDLGGGAERRLQLFMAWGYRPLARTDEWETRFAPAPIVQD